MRNIVIGLVIGLSAMLSVSAAYAAQTETANITSNAAAATALTPEEIDLRARKVGRALRCVVCQNQSIEDSDASLAADMRRLVRAQIAQGATNEEVIAFMRMRYGDFVLLEPPVQPNTYALWAAPFLFLLFGLFAFWRLSRKSENQLGNPSSEHNSEL